MNSSRLLIAAAWIGTAIVAYSIGTLRSPSPAAPASTTSTDASVAAAQAMAAAEHDAEHGERPWDGGHGARTRTLTEIVGQQPLGDYLKRVLALEDDIKRTSAFMEVLETLQTPEQIREALEAVAKSGRGWGRGPASREYAMLLQKWTSMDPKAAADYAVKAAGRDERYMAMSNVLRTWTRLDSHAALAWAKANGAATSIGTIREGDGNIAVTMVASQLARTDIDLALQAIASEADSRSASRLGDDLTNELFKKRGPEKTRETILAMPESRLRDAMLGEYIDRLADDDGPGAAKFAASLPAGRARSYGLAEAVAEWLKDDPAATANFLNSLPLTPDSDPARERFAREVAGKDPLGAISWAGTITDARQRQETTERVIRSWVRNDSAAATPWVMQSNLSEETKQRLLTPDNRGRN